MYEIFAISTVPKNTIIHCIISTVSVFHFYVIELYGSLLMNESVSQSAHILSTRYSS